MVAKLACTTRAAARRYCFTAQIRQSRRETVSIATSSLFLLNHPAAVIWYSVVAPICVQRSVPSCEYAVNQNLQRRRRTPP